MTTFAPPDNRCRLCGNADPRDIRLTLVHWNDAPKGMAYEHVPACTDRDACRARCLAGGDTWPLVETSTKHKHRVDAKLDKGGAMDGVCLDCGRTVWRSGVGLVGDWQAVR